LQAVRLARGGVMILTAGIAVNVTWLPGASDVNQLGGKAVNLGVGVGEGIVGGVDRVVSPQTNGENLHGISFSLGGGAKEALLPLPGDVHVGVTQTHLTQRRINIYEIYKAQFAGW
jgi:hypothetical protein